MFRTILIAVVILTFAVSFGQVNAAQSFKIAQNFSSSGPPKPEPEKPLNCKGTPDDQVAACKRHASARGTPKYALEACSCALRSDRLSKAERITVLLLRGRARFDSRHMKSSLDDFDEVLRHDPKNVEAHYRRGRTFLSSSGVKGMPKGPYNAALEAFNTALKLDPSHLRARIWRGNAYAAKRNPRRAIKDYDQALRLKPRSVHAFWRRGRAYFRLGRFRRAIEDYDAALKIVPGYTKARLLRDEALAAMPEAERASVPAAPARAAKKTPPKTAKKRDDGMLSIVRQRIAKRDKTGSAHRRDLSSGSLVRSRKKKQKSARVETRKTATLARACNRRLAPKAAISACGRALEAGVKTASIHFVRGQAYYRTRDYQNAIKDYDEALGLKPNRATRTATLVHRARAYSRSRKYTEALADFGAALKLDPNDAATHFGRGEVYLQALNKPAKALPDFNKAVALNADYLDAHYLRGLAHLRLRQHKAAVRDFSTAIALKPKFELALRDRASAHAGLKRFAAAEKDL
ncbi:MAG: tetratricopeptide repeat protein, partial [Pseudomonadota bacterium]